MNHVSISARRRQGGFTIVEMMVAVTIGLVVMFGFSVTFVNMKRAFVSQGQYAQLQDNERLAMSIVTNALSEAGYFPTPWIQGDRKLVIAAAPGTFAAMDPGQYLLGEPLAAGNHSERVSTAFTSASKDGKLTCLGGTNTTALATTVRNVFYVDYQTNTLGCAVIATGPAATDLNSDFQPLISNVKDMTVLYGVALTSDAKAGVVEYRKVDDMLPTQWSLVKSVQVTLTFLNPFSATDPPITWVQNVTVMNNRL